jgi:hypothetical protein
MLLIYLGVGSRLGIGTTRTILESNAIQAIANRIAKPIAPE